MKRKTLYFLVILILALFTVNSIVKINSYALIRSQKTDKGVKFNNNGKIEYLDVGIDKIKFNFEQKEYKNFTAHYIDIYNGSKYPIVFSREYHSKNPDIYSINYIDIKFEKLNKDGEKYNDYKRVEIEENMRPIENKKAMINHIINSYPSSDYKFQNFKFTEINYRIFKDDLLYHVSYDCEKAIYTTYVSKPINNIYVKASEKGVEFDVNDEKEIIDVTIKDFEFNTDIKQIENNLYQGEFSYTNKSKYPILSMKYNLAEILNSYYIPITYAMAVLPNEQSPIRVFTKKDFSNKKPLYAQYEVLKDDTRYTITYDFILDRYTLDSVFYVLAQKIDNGLEFYDEIIEKAEIKYKKEYLDFDMDDIEFITPNVDKTNKYTITKDTTIKNNSKYPIYIDAILKNKKSNRIVDYVYVEDNLILFNEESKIKIEEDSYDIDDENIENLDEEYEILQIECDLYVGGKRHNIDYTPKLDLYDVIKFD